MNPGMEPFRGFPSLSAPLAPLEENTYGRERVFSDLAGKQGGEVFGTLQRQVSGSASSETPRLPDLTQLDPTRIALEQIESFLSHPLGDVASLLQRDLSFARKLLGLLQRLRGVLPHSPFWLEHKEEDGEEAWIIYVRLGEPRQDLGEQKKQDLLLRQKKLFSTFTKYLRELGDPDFTHKVWVYDLP